MRLLITGSSGFVGNSILKYLKRDKNLKIETLSKSKPNSADDRNSDSHHFVDLSNPNFADFFKLNRFDLLIHAAWYGLPLKNAINNEKNFRLSAELFERFVDAGGRAIVGIGSCLEYGERLGRVAETDSGINLSNFGIVKRSVNSQICEIGIPYVWLRPFYLYGNRQHQNSLLNLSLRKLNYSEGSWIKEPFLANDFVYVDDLGRIVEMLISNELWLGELNVGTSSLVHNISFVNLIRKMLGKREHEFPETPVKGIAADLTKLKQYLPSFSFLNLEDGLSAYLRDAK